MHKLDVLGQEVLAYPTRLVGRGPGWVQLEGFYARPDVDFPGLVIRRGDRLLETFYADHWYNVFAVYEGARGALRGWYCNITRPARIESQDVFADDLALDLIVDRRGHTHVLDEDEFERLRLAPEEEARARAALQHLRELAARRTGPFASLRNGSAPA